jgi:hypothetical protein
MPGKMSREELDEKVRELNRRYIEESLEAHGIFLKCMGPNCKGCRCKSFCEFACRDED